MIRAFELRYWKWALKTAQQWRERLQLAPDSNYQQVIDGLPRNMATHDGLYLAAASAPDSYTNPHYMSDHPMVLGAIGMIPSDDTISQESCRKPHSTSSPSNGTGHPPGAGTTQ